MKKYIILAIVISLIIPIVGANAKAIVEANEKNGIDTEHFQRLIDVKLFNSTELLPEYIVQTALIPKGFFGPLEKKLNISELPKRKELHDLNPNVNFKDNQNQTNPNVNFKDNQNQTIFKTFNGKYVTFTGNVSKIWSKSLDDYVVPTIVPDIDGDGLGDIITTKYNYDPNTGVYYYTFDARKGLNGNILWTKFLGGKIKFAYMMSAGDLNGDGSGDILWHIVEYNTDSGKYDSWLNGVNGKDGTIIWQRYFPSTWITPYLSRDLNGFGPDILVNTNFDYGNPYTVQTLDGRNGDTFWQDSSDLYMWGYPAGDMDNDGEGFADIILNKRFRIFVPWQYINYYFIDAINVKYSKTIWELSKSDTNYITYFGRPLYRDLNADNIEDIYTDYLPWTGSEDFELEVKSGHTGTSLWNYLRGREYPYASIYGLNDLNNDGFNDVLIDLYTGTGVSTQSNIIEIRLGNNGICINSYAFCSKSIKATANKFAYIYYYPAGDLDGDGLDDIIFNIDIENSDKIDKSIMTYKGKDGSILWQENISYNYGDPVYKDIFAYPAGDIDKDGSNDVLVKEVLDVYGILAKKGSNGKLLWEALSPFDIGVGYGITDQVMPKPTWTYSDLNRDGYYDIILAPKNELFAVTGDVIPPSSVTDLRNITYKPTYIKWVWKDPSDNDLARVKVYINGIWKADVRKGVQTYNSTGLIPNTSYRISTRTIDIFGNANATYVSKTAKTARDYVAPYSITLLRNITYKKNYINWTWKDPIDKDLSFVKVYINGNWKKDIRKGIQSYNSTGLKNNTWYKISTRTVDTSGNVNRTWANKTAKTAS